MNASHFIAIGSVLALVGIIVLAIVMERRERRKAQDRERLGLGGRACKSRTPWYTP